MIANHPIALSQADTRSIYNYVSPMYLFRFEYKWHQPSKSSSAGRKIIARIAAAQRRVNPNAPKPRYFLEAVVIPVRPRPTSTVVGGRSLRARTATSTGHAFYFGEGDEPEAETELKSMQHGRVMALPSSSSSDEDQTKAREDDAGSSSSSEYESAQESQPEPMHRHAASTPTNPAAPRMVATSVTIPTTPTANNTKKVFASVAVRSGPGPNKGTKRKASVSSFGSASRSPRPRTPRMNRILAERIVRTGTEFLVQWGEKEGRASWVPRGEVDESLVDEWEEPSN